jgi:hypothetical protein
MFHLLKALHGMHIDVFHIAIFTSPGFHPKICHNLYIIIFMKTDKKHIASIVTYSFKIIREFDNSSKSAVHYISICFIFCQLYYIHVEFRPTFGKRGKYL